MTQAIAAPDLSPNFLPVAYFVRGDAYYDKKQCESAIADYSAGLNLKPDDFRAHLIRADCYSSEYKIDQAQADLTAAIAARPDLVQGYASLGNAYVQWGKYDLAVSQFTIASGIDPSDFGLYQLRGNAYRAEAHYDQALADEKSALEINSKYWIAYYTRGLVYDDEGKFSDALDDFERAKELSSDSSLSQNAGLTQWEMGKFGEAEKVFADFAKSQPQNAYMTLWLDLARTKAGKPDDDQAQRAANLDLTKWPGPLVNLSLGKVSPDQVFQAAKIGDANTAQAHKCDADFFVGEWQLLHQNPTAAKPLFADELAGCRNETFGWRAANTELKQLP